MDQEEEDMTKKKSNSSKPRPKTKEASAEARMQQYHQSLVSEAADIDCKLATDPKLKNLNPYEKHKIRSDFWFIQANEFMETQNIESKRRGELEDLDNRIKNGQLLALKELVFWSTESTRLLTEWATRCPEFVGVVAADHPSWPLLCTLSKSQNSKLVELLQKIHLDSRRPLSVSAVDIGPNPTPAKRWAARLVREIDQARCAMTDDFRRDPTNAIQVIGSSEVERIDQKYPSIKEAVAGLPPFSSSSWKKWWKVAKELFLLMTNQRPFDLPELASYAMTSRVKHESGAKTDGIKRSEVLKVVEQAFKNLALKIK
jgi:hypothetical protein